MNRTPSVFEIAPPDPFDALRRFLDVEPVLLESASVRPRLGRYSFLTADGFAVRQERQARFGIDPTGPVADLMSRMPAATVPGLPPFQGGAIGLLGYELGRVWEQLPEPRPDQFDVPDFRVALFDWVLAWDHELDRAWLVAHDLPKSEHLPAGRRSADRLAWARARLEVPANPPAPAGSRTRSTEATSNFTRSEYVRAVERVVEYVRAGDIFQVNLARQLQAESDLTPLDLYGRLRTANPAPFAAFYAADDWAIVSASPERFLQLTGRSVETRPIKGTRRRSTDPAEDLRLRQELLASEKDRAENVMIVDLLRNDLSRVCRPGTVTVPELCVLETYETVHHLVSAVRGELDERYSPWDLFSAAFPGGSVTGAPKVRAMEIIREIEPNPRGPYCGSLFYVGFDGAADSNILIRTIVCRGDRVRIGIGGGVTAGSEPDAEYRETSEKAAGMLRAFA